MHEQTIDLWGQNACTKDQIESYGDKIHVQRYGEESMGHDVRTEDQFYGDTRNTPMGTGCMYTESIYVDKHAYNGPIIWGLDAFQRTNPMGMESIWEHSVCTKDQSYRDMMHGQEKNQCMMPVCTKEQSYKGTQCMCKGPILWGHDVCTKYIQLVWGHDVFTKYQYLGSRACTKDQSYGDTISTFEEPILCGPCASTMAQS